MQVDWSAEMIEDCTKAEGWESNAPEPDHTVEKVLLEVIILFPIDRPRNDEARKNEENDNIVLPILRTKPHDMPTKEPIKIGMTQEHSDGCGKP